MRKTRNLKFGVPDRAIRWRKNHRALVRSEASDDSGIGDAVHGINKYTKNHKELIKTLGFDSGQGHNKS